MQPRLHGYFAHTVLDLRGSARETGDLRRCTTLDLARASQIEEIVQSTPHTVAQSWLHLDSCCRDAAKIELLSRCSQSCAAGKGM